MTALWGVTRSTRPARFAGQLVFQRPKRRAKLKKPPISFFPFVDGLAVLQFSFPLLLDFGFQVLNLRPCPVKQSCAVIENFFESLQARCASFFGQELLHNMTGSELHVNQDTTCSHRRLVCGIAVRLISNQEPAPWFMRRVLAGGFPEICLE